MKKKIKILLLLIVLSGLYFVSSFKQIIYAESEPTDSVSEEESTEEQSPNNIALTVSGTSVLVGAGVYTFVRQKRKSQKEEQKNQTPVYYKNYSQEKRDLL